MLPVKMIFKVEKKETNKHTDIWFKSIFLGATHFLQRHHFYQTQGGPSLQGQVLLCAPGGTISLLRGELN